MLREPSLTSVIRILGLIYIIKCFSRVPSALYVKELNFKTKAIIELSAEVFNSTVAITLAFLKFGVWSLVYAYLVKQLITFIGFWKFCPWRLRPEFDWHIARELIHFGKFVFSSSLLWFLVKNLDRMVIGRLLGTVILGFYAIAYNIANLTATHFTGLVSQVMFPAYSKIQNDRNKMEEVFLRTMKYISLVSIPFCVGIFILAPDFLRIVYGEKWLPAAAAEVVRTYRPTGMLLDDSEVLACLSFKAALSLLAEASDGAFLIAAGEEKSALYVHGKLLNGDIPEEILSRGWGTGEFGGRLYTVRDVVPGGLYLVAAMPLRDRGFPAWLGAAAMFGVFYLAVLLAQLPLKKAHRAALEERAERDALLGEEDMPPDKKALLRQRRAELESARC